MIKAKTSNEKFSIILDTHILVWYMEGINLSDQQIHLIEESRKSGNLYISTISIWEISMLVNKGRIVLSISLTEWVKKLLSTPGLNMIDLSISILMQSYDLPNYDYRDPADRLIIASSRSINSYLMTHDQKIIDYANKGYLKLT